MTHPGPSRKTPPPPAPAPPRESKKVGRQGEQRAQPSYRRPRPVPPGIKYRVCSSRPPNRWRGAGTRTTTGTRYQSKYSLSFRRFRTRPIPGTGRQGRISRVSLNSLKASLPHASALVPENPLGPIARGLLAAVVVVVAGLCLLASSSVQAQVPGQDSAQGPDGPAFPVDDFVVGYPDPWDDLPLLNDLLPIRVPLRLTPTGYVAPRAGQETESVTIGGPRELAWFHASALGAVSRALLARLHGEGMLGVYVRPNPEDIALREERDLRDQANHALPPGYLGGTHHRCPHRGRGQPDPKRLEDQQSRPPGYPQEFSPWAEARRPRGHNGPDRSSSPGGLSLCPESAFGTPGRSGPSGLGRGRRNHPGLPGLRRAPLERLRPVCQHRHRTHQSLANPCRLREPPTQRPRRRAVHQLHELRPRQRPQHPSRLRSPLVRPPTRGLGWNPAPGNQRCSSG